MAVSFSEEGRRGFSHEGEWIRKVTPGHNIAHFVLVIWMAENNILNFKDKFNIKGMNLQQPELKKA